MAGREVRPHGPRGREPAALLREALERPVDSKVDHGQTCLDLQRFLRAAVYGCYAFHPERFRRIARQHAAEVARHFAGRDDLLVLDIAAGQGYERLAPFLGLPVPGELFPRHNHGATAENAPWT